MATTHISEADAVRDMAALLARVRGGEEIVIESGATPVAVLSPAGPPRRPISESIALAEAGSKELGYKLVMDAEYAGGTWKRLSATAGPLTEAHGTDS